MSMNPESSSTNFDLVQRAPAVDRLEQTALRMRLEQDRRLPRRRRRPGFAGSIRIRPIVPLSGSPIDVQLRPASIDLKTPPP